MIALLHLVLAALVAGVATSPSSVEMGGCHEQITVPGFAESPMLALVEGELVDPELGLGGIEGADIGEGAWVGLSCWAPASERFVMHDDDEPGIRLVLMVRAPNYLPLNERLSELALAQARYREANGAFSASLEELGFEPGDLVDLEVSAEDGWTAWVANDLLWCTLTERNLRRYDGDLRVASGCQMTDDEAWMAPLRQFWADAHAQAGR